MVLRCGNTVHEHFNPRSRERSDQNESSRNYRAFDFNPRSRERSDVNLGAPVPQWLKFQSTLPRRERLQCVAHGRCCDEFQSTLP